jgi:hypothetical protein
MSRLYMTLTDRRTWWRLPRYELRPHLEGGWRGEPVVQEGWEIVGEVAELIRFNLPESILPDIQRLKLRDEQSVLAFVNKFGALGTRKADFDDGRLDIDRPFLAELDSSPTAHLETGVTQRRRRQSETELVEDFQAGAASIQRAVALAAELANGDEFNVRNLADLDDPSGVWEHPPPNKTAARYQLARIVNTGLSAYRIRAVQKRGAGSPMLTVEPTLSLFAVACLDLAEAAQRGLPWRHCAAKGCGQFFQPRRSDQIYHHASCARAEASRTYRLRKRQERGS